ncbi:MAG: restriction endonuclease subunit S [Anaerostipes sp.]
MEKLLTEVCDIQYGFPFDSGLFNDSEGIPLIRIRDVKRGYSETYTTEEYSKEYVVNEGDILIGMDGEFNIAKWGKTPAVLNQRVCRVFPHNDIDANYIFYSLPQELKKIEARTSFATVKHLSAKEINKIEIQVPTLKEQRIIAKKIAIVENVITQRQETIRTIGPLNQSPICRDVW